MQSATEISLATIEPTWKVAARVWWSWWWRTTVVTYLLTLAIGFWAGMFLAPGRAQTRAQQIGVIFVSALVGLYFFKDVLDRDFGHFRACIIPKGTSDEPKSPAVDNVI
jgi:hypothetical protein